MVQLWRSFSILFPLAVVVGSIAFVVVSLASWVHADGERTWAAVRRACYDGLFAVWVVGVAVLTLSPGAGAGMPGMEPSVRLVPFADITDLLTSSVHWEVPFVQIGGNLVLFAVGGALLTLRRGHQVWRVALTFLALGLAIEATQFFVGGRSAVLDDVILAGLGAGIGAAAVTGARRLARRPGASSSTPTGDEVSPTARYPTCGEQEARDRQ